MKNVKLPAVAGNAFFEPLVVAKGRISSEDIWQLELKAFGEFHCFDLRRWRATTGEPPQPTAKGLMLPVKHLPAIAAGLVQAIEIIDIGEG